MPLQTLRAHLLSIFLRRTATKNLPSQSIPNSSKCKRVMKNNVTLTTSMSHCWANESLHGIKVYQSQFSNGDGSRVHRPIPVAKRRLRHVSRPVSPNGLGRTMTSGDRNWNWWKRGPDKDGNWNKVGFTPPLQVSTIWPSLQLSSSLGIPQLLGSEKHKKSYFIYLNIFIYFQPCSSDYILLQGFAVMLVTSSSPALAPRPPMDVHQEGSLASLSWKSHVEWSKPEFALEMFSALCGRKTLSK